MTKIHPDDDMYCGSLDHYISCGRQLASVTYLAANKFTSTVTNILEVPCGYGRVTRHLVSFFPFSRVVVADIMEPAVKFCVSQFGASGIVVSNPVMEFSEIQNKHFDLAVMGSLVTHLSEVNSKAVLKNFLAKLAPNGVGVITTHGARVYSMLKSGQQWFEIRSQDRFFLMSQYSQNKYGFVNYSGGHSFERKTVDFAGNSYGVSIIPHQWMLEELAQNNVILLDYLEGGWDNHQDVYLVRCAIA